MSIRSVAAITAILFGAHAEPGVAQADRFDLGVRAVLKLADGVPANDIPGYGIFAHYRLSDRWTLGAAVDRAVYDVETPAKLVGIEQDPNEAKIDALAESTTFSVWAERTFRAAGSRNSWFLSVGIGIASIDVPAAAGPRSDGGTFDIRTDVPTELVASLGAGWRRELGRRWFFEFALRADQHFADWKLSDRISGASGSVSDYFAYGGNMGIGFRF